MGAWEDAAWALYIIMCVRKDGWYNVPSDDILDLQIWYRILFCNLQPSQLTNNLSLNNNEQKSFV